jgi:hypothetical protein
MVFASSKFRPFGQRLEGTSTTSQPIWCRCVVAQGSPIRAHRGSAGVTTADDLFLARPASLADTARRSMKGRSEGETVMSRFDAEAQETLAHGRLDR